ncbi:hypothetical protein GCM10010919_12600 [Alishewanella longhuensis]|uniref:Uncharacterized protein n=1 Tax=Alishewanella longhuensis TaxID=1091037 RepID=A0ABQ3KWS3_9ALTE|nr:hypothetical protein GCM10010919_12600 [Alishewanella longhuensis]
MKSARAVSNTDKSVVSGALNLYTLTFLNHITTLVPFYVKSRSITRTNASCSGVDYAYVCLPLYLS